MQWTNGCRESVSERVMWILDENGQGKRGMNDLEEMKRKRNEGLM